jgi:hypothetical protein
MLGNYYDMGMKGLRRMVRHLGDNTHRHLAYVEKWE